MCGARSAAGCAQEVCDERPCAGSAREPMRKYHCDDCRRRSDTNPWGPYRTRGILAHMRRHPTLVEFAARLLCAAGVPALAARRQRRRLAIVMFHGVEAEPLSPPCSHVHDARTLRRELRYVSRRFNVLPLEEALERLNAGTLPDR